MNNQKYVYKNTEVVLTGRKASKPANKPPRRSEIGPRTPDTLFEVIPADPKNGTWTSWVILEDLYEIFNEEIK